MTIREERPADFPEIYELVQAAFKTAKVADGSEQDFVDKLRQRKGYIPEFALVAEKDGKLIGHIMLTETELAGEDGQGSVVLMLAPLLECRSKGVGAALVCEAMKRAAAKSYKAVFLAGDPAYYSRFGFRPSVEFGIGNTDGVPDEFSLAAELTPGALKGIEGVVVLA